MSEKTRKHVDDLRGASRLAIQATKSVTDLVEAMHVTIAGGPSILGSPLEAPMRAVTGLVYGSIRGVTDLVGSGIDLALGRLAPLLGESTPGFDREAVLSALNGVLGDYLLETHNPLAIDMRLRHHGTPLTLSKDALSEALPEATGKIVVLVHGSCMNDLEWKRAGHDHGAELARELGVTPIYLYYNSGLHISANGHAFADLLEALIANWPVPIEELTLLAHSMGGLVSRSACHSAEERKLTFRSKLTRLICLGTPHHGAPLERGGNWIDLLLSISRYSSPLGRLGKIRSAGVTDMRFGFVTDAHWQGRDRFEKGKDPRRDLALPEGVSCFAMAASLSPAQSEKPSGDGLVPVDSALGRHRKPSLQLAFPEAHQSVVYATGHLDLLDRKEVFTTLVEWMRA